MFMVGKKEVEIVNRFGGPDELDSTKLSNYVRTVGADVDDIWSAPTTSIYQKDAPKPPKPPRVQWVDRNTGEVLSANQEFIDRLPLILAERVGKENAMHVPDILFALKVDVTDSDAVRNAERQLRFAKSYIQANTAIPMCSERSQDGGYFIAATRQEVLVDAETYRASAAGNIRAAEELEALADRAFPVEV